MAARASSLERVVRASAEVADAMAATTGAQRAAALTEMADAIERRAEEIARENQDDMAQAKRARMDGRELDVLLLDADRIHGMAERMRAVAALPDPLGRIEHGGRLPGGTRIHTERVPLGVVALVYESAPHVTTDAAALCLRAGNVAVLRGGPAAHRTNRILTEVLEGALVESGAPRAALCMIGPDAAELDRLVRLDGLVDLLVLRGPVRDVERLAATASVPVLAAPAGVAHVYVDAAADPDVAARIAMSLATPRPRESTFLETLVVHEAVASAFGPSAVEALARHGVATRIVASLEDAIEVIRTQGTGHAACVITDSSPAAARFERQVGTATVLVNASPRFIDASQLGLGAMLGVSVQPVHARGPITLEQLTTTRSVVVGDGQVP